MQRLEKLELIWQSLPLLGEGVLVTMTLTISLLGVGLLLGIPVALGQAYGPRPVRLLMSSYERFFRAMPILVLLIVCFYGLGFWGIYVPAFGTAVVVFGLHSSAYQSQIFRGAIQAIKEGQLLAARALGMSRLQAIRYIVLPQALRLSLPGWSNEYSGVLKDTSFVFAIGVTELTRQGWQIAMRTREIFLVFITVAVIYLILTYLGTWLLERIERRLSVPGLAGQRREEHGRVI
ncbi:MAG: amino acid ABC transporter permease [Candidatus Bipolaricaulota bacterium]|nr:amino acid ABC transporter permease [Candidatus Bipolaricaulota bacterium]MDW8141077.1 amino acid ABC transporter permease [Candidatus Bipolaricaulota bacterium]